MKFLFLILIFLTQPLWGQSADEAFEQAMDEAAAESEKEAQARTFQNKDKKDSSEEEEAEEPSPSAAKDEEQLALPVESEEEAEAQAKSEEEAEAEAEPEANPVQAVRKKRKKTTTAGVVKTRAPRKKIEIWQLGPRFMMWQEKVQARETMSSYVYQGRFTAIAVGISHKKAMGSSRRWLYDINGDLIIGSVKASSTIGGQTDELQSQSFYGLQVSPGLVYRTNNNTMVGIGAPLFVRKVDWKLSRPTLQMDDATTVDFGLGVNGQWRMRRDQFLKVGVTYRQSGSLWTFAYDFTI